MAKNRMGIVINAYRLGYRQLPDGDGFLRISQAENGILCELAPTDTHVPKTSRRDMEKLHYCWWETEDNGRGIINCSPVLRAIKRVNKPFAVVLDPDTGEAVAQGTGGVDHGTRA